MISSLVVSHIRIAIDFSIGRIKPFVELSVVPCSVLYVQHPKKTKQNAIQIRLQIEAQNNADSGHRQTG